MSEIGTSGLKTEPSNATANTNVQLKPITQNVVVQNTQQTSSTTPMKGKNINVQLILSFYQILVFL